ncbi:acetyltransferase [Glaciibacter superstes]|uniref:PglD-related sugar-binding protein n=1 Tax=Glaciibacter superstes TaxID=501023 RepID=UPI0003B7B39F|nr:acetyltransferase [Glaciibacter superstes]
MPRDVVVVGMGGFGRELLDVVEAHNAAVDERLNVIGIVDDDPSVAKLDRIAARGYRYLGASANVIATHTPVGYILGVGNPNVRRQLAEVFDAAGWHAVSVVHPSASVGSVGVVADGAVVCGGVQLSTNTILGRHVHLNPGAIVGHDARVGDFTSVNPGAIVSGEVVLGIGVLIGAGAVVLQGLTVGANSIVGAAACVTRDVAAGRTVIGIPARPIVLPEESTP